MHHRTVAAGAVAIALSAAVTAALIGAIPATAAARPPRPSALVSPPLTITRLDPNDSRGSLDIASVRVHRARRDTITWTLHGPASIAQLEPKHGFFVIAYDTNDNGKWDYYQYAFMNGGRRKLVGRIVDAHTRGQVAALVPGRRIGPKTYQQTVLRSKIGNPLTYRFALFSFDFLAPCATKRPCVDAIPNRIPPIVVDHRAPYLSHYVTYPASSDVETALVSPVSFVFHDDRFGTGIRNWAVQRQVVGTTTWTTVRTGTTLSPTVPMPGVQGVSYRVRVVVTDRQRNEAISPIHETAFPFDDRNAALDYSGSPLAWVQNDVGTEPVPKALLGSTSTGPQTATVHVTVPASRTVCLLGGPTTGPVTSVTFSVNGDAGDTVTEDGTTSQRAQIGCRTMGASAITSVDLTVTGAEPFVLDGIVAAA